MDSRTIITHTLTNASINMGRVKELQDLRLVASRRVRECTFLDYELDFQQHLFYFLRQ